MALVTDLVPQAQRSAAMGLFIICGSDGFPAGFLLGGFLTDAYEHLVAFIAVGSLKLTLAVVALPAVRQLMTDHKPGVTPRADSRRVPQWFKLSTNQLTQPSQTILCAQSRSLR